MLQLVAKKKIHDNVLALVSNALAMVSNPGELNFEINTQQTTITGYCYLTTVQRKSEPLFQPDSGTNEAN